MGNRGAHGRWLRGYYLCRSNLSVCIPLIRDDLLLQGYDPDTAKQRLGLVVSFGVLAYAIGKFIAGDWPIFKEAGRILWGG